MVSGELSSIRPALQSDTPAIVELEALCFDENLRLDAQLVTDYLQDPMRKTYVAEHEGRVVAFIACCLFGLTKPPYVATPEITSIDVHPDFRGRGICHHLMDVVEEEYRRLDYTEIKLQVDLKNTIAIHTYQGRKYRLDAVLEDYYPGKKPAMQMVKSL